MKNRRILTILLVFILIFNIITLSFLIFEVNLVKAPETLIKLDLVEIDSEEAIIKTFIEMYNPNNFDLVVKDLKVLTSILDGKIISSINEKGGTVHSFQSKTFTTKSKIDLQEGSLNLITSKISGKGGVNVFFFKKTIPFHFTVETSIGELVEDLQAPEVEIKTEFEDLNQNFINLSLNVTAYNPNNFDISLDNITFQLLDDEHKKVGFSEFDDILLEGKKRKNFDALVSLNIVSFDSEELRLKMSSNVSALVAGYIKIIPFSLMVTIVMPDLEKLLVSDVPTDGIIRSNYRLSFFGIVDEISLEISNPNKIEFFTKDIKASIFRVDNGKETLIGVDTIEGGVIKPESKTVFKGEVLMPYKKLLFSSITNKILPDFYKIQIRANVTIKGLNSYFWVGVSAYDDLNILIA